MSNPHKHCNHHLHTCFCKISRILELEIDMDMLGEQFASILQSPPHTLVLLNMKPKEDWNLKFKYMDMVTDRLVCEFLDLRIPYMAAALELQKAEKKADEAMAAAAALGVHLGNGPRNPSLVSKPADLSSGSGGAANHNISATLETAFDVDKEVAAALKAALLRHTSDLKDAELRNAMRLIKEQQNLEAAGGVQPDWVDHASEASSAEESSNGGCLCLFVSL